MKTLAAWALALLFTAPAAHALDRPGLHLARGQRLLIDGDLDGAEAEARRVLAAWPDAARARILLAQVARARGDEATAQRLLAAVEATGARLARLEAQRLRAPASAPLRLHLALGGQLDTRAVSTPVVAISPPALGDVPAWRALVAGDVGLDVGPVEARIGVERTLHFEAGEEADMATLDRTALWVEGRTQTTAGPTRLGLSLLGRAALAGRPGDLAYGGPGATAWLQIPGPVTTPWLRVSALGLALADADPLAWAEAEVGAEVRLGRVRLGPTLQASWLGPDGWREAGAAGRLAVTAGPVQPALTGGAAIRDDDRGLRPHATAALRVPLGAHAATRLEGAWQSVADRHRLLGGLHLEFWR